MFPPKAKPWTAMAARSNAALYSEHSGNKFDRFATTSAIAFSDPKARSPFQRELVVVTQGGMNPTIIFYLRMSECGACQWLILTASLGNTRSARYLDICV